MFILNLFILLFTFHYGSILISIVAAEDIITPEFTFHYGSILICEKFSLELPRLIYIPLWFYSNVMSSESADIIMHLHSTMVLF